MCCASKHRVITKREAESISIWSEKILLSTRRVSRGWQLIISSHHWRIVLVSQSLSRNWYHTDSSNMWREHEAGSSASGSDGASGSELERVRKHWHRNENWNENWHQNRNRNRHAGHVVTSGGVRWAVRTDRGRVATCPTYQIMHLHARAHCGTRCNCTMQNLIRWSYENVAERRRRGSHEVEDTKTQSAESRNRTHGGGTSNVSNRALREGGVELGTREAESASRGAAARMSKAQRQEWPRALCTLRTRIYRLVKRKRLRKLSGRVMVSCARIMAHRRAVKHAPVITRMSYRAWRTAYSGCCLIRAAQDLWALPPQPRRALCGALGQCSASRDLKRIVHKRTNTNTSTNERAGG